MEGREQTQCSLNTRVLTEPLEVEKKSSGAGLEEATLLKSSWNTVGKKAGALPGEICKASYLYGVSHLFYLHGNKHSFLVTNINVFSSRLLRHALF